MVMLKYIAAVGAMMLLLGASWPAGSAASSIPEERSFPSTVGEVIFHHQMHTKDLSVKCVECHHSIGAKELVTPHPAYANSSPTQCEMCHVTPGATKQNAYTCSGCHEKNPMNIADETLSAKVVIHKQCWKCHPVGTGKEASVACVKCHSGKKTF